MAEEFNLDSFIEGLEQDSKVTSKFSAEDRLNKVLMNTHDNQGTLAIVPFISKKVGNVYFKLEGVREFNTYTSVIDREDPIWYRILPIEFYGELTPTQMELYNQVTGLWDQLFDSEELDYDEIRKRNYSMFTGVALSMKNSSGQSVKDFPLNVPGLFIYPSINVIEAFNKAVTAKRSVLGDKVKLFLQKIITPSRSGREGIIQITYQKAAVGYDATVNLETNSEYTTFTDPSYEYSEEFVANFDDPVSVFIGWMYDSEGNSRFNETVFTELKKALELKLKEVTSATNAEQPAVANINGSIDPMRPPVPGADQSSKTQRPF